MKNYKTKLSKQDYKVLYCIWKHKAVIQRHYASVGFVHSQFIGELDEVEVKDSLKRLCEQGYIKFKSPDSDEFGIPDAQTFQKIKKLLWKYRLKDWIIQVWDFLWKHFIITIITAAITSVFTHLLIHLLIR
jgi:hypothetical protein